METTKREIFKKNFKKNREAIITFSVMVLLSIISLIIFILFFEKLDLCGAVLLGGLFAVGILVLPELLKIWESCFFETTETEEESDSDL